MFPHAWTISHQHCVRTNDSQGDTFLRSAYIVFDLDNEEISIGKALFNVTDSNIVEIGTGTNPVPDATGAASAVTVAPTGTGGGRSGGLPYVSGAITNTAPSATATKKSAASSYRFTWATLTLSLALMLSGIVHC